MFAAMVAAVMMIGTAAAQTEQNNDGQECKKMTAEQMAKMQTELMTQKLGLSQRQQRKLYDYDIKRFNELQKKAETHHNAMESARKEHGEKMKKILSPEQYRMWVEMQK